MEDKMIDSLRKLEQLDSQQLEEMLHAETQKETPDDDLVLQILDILKTRDAEKPIELSPKSQVAWKKYQAKARARGRKSVIRMGWIVKAASFVLIAGLMGAAFLPKDATAGSFWKILTSWTEDFFQYENIGAEETEPKEYVFQSDNPGLQQVYESVVEELGITEPVVATWLPGEPSLISLRVVETPAFNRVRAIFDSDNGEIVLIFDKMIEDVSPSFNKTEKNIVELEINGIKHNFIRNNDYWILSWAKQNIKCSIYIDCQEDILKDIVRSIY